MNIERKVFSINFNAQHLNGMTHFHLAVHNGQLVKTCMTDIAEELLTEENHALNNRHMTPQLQQRRCFCKSYTFPF